MTETSISLLSILFGILGAISVKTVFPKQSFSLTGNVIIGVFASVFIIKSFGRLGFDPVSVMKSGEVDVLRLSLNLFLSVTSGFSGVLLSKRMAKKFNSKAN